MLSYSSSLEDHQPYLYLEWKSTFIIQFVKEEPWHTNIMPRFSLRALFLDCISLYGRVWDIEILAMRQEVIKKLFALLTDILPDQVCDSAMSDISPSKGPHAKEVPKWIKQTAKGNKLFWIW